MKILVLCGDHWHPARTPWEGLSAVAGNLFTFDWVETAHDWSPERLKLSQVVILTKSAHVSDQNQTGWLTDDIQVAIVDYVSKGKGLLAIHSGVVGYDQVPGLQSLLGGTFTHHPRQCPVTIEPLQGHPLSHGVAPATLIDEHYFIALHDPQVDVYMTTRSEHGDQPGAWRRTAGAGRVAVMTPGHNLPVWQHPAFQGLLLNTLRWCGKLDDSNA